MARVQARALERDRADEGPRHAWHRRGPDEPRGLGPNRGGEGAIADRGRRAGVRRVLPIRRRPGGRDRRGHQGDHPARRLVARRRGDRGVREGRRADGLHLTPALPALTEVASRKTEVRDARLPLWANRYGCETFWASRTLRAGERRGLDHKELQMFGRNDERIVYSDATVAEAPRSPGGAVLGAALPEIGLLRSGIRNHKGRLFLILTGTAVLGVALLVAISWLNGKDAKGGQAGAAKFATALVRNQPNLAADGAAGYVAGARAYFGPVSSAKIIAGHERGVNSRHTADESTYYVVEMMVQSM